MSLALQTVGVLIMQGAFFLMMHTKSCKLMQFKQLKLLANSNQEALPCYGCLLYCLGALYFWYS